MKFLVEVTAEHIAAADRQDGKDLAGVMDPVELALEATLGQAVTCDGDGFVDEAPREVATIGAGQTTIVLNLPPEPAAWTEAWYAGKPVEPFSFEFEIEKWLVDLIAGGLEPSIEARIQLAIAREKAQTLLDMGVQF